MKYFLVLFMIFVSTAFVASAQCNEDCVWPGDLNANGIANNLDILAFGFSLGEMGAARLDQTVLWDAYTADDWLGNLPGLNSNFKHSDADGNGVVNSNDQFPVSINYNQTNDDFVGLLGNDLLGNDLFLVPQNLVAAPGGVFVLDIHLGSAGDPIDNIYGIGFQINVDTQYVTEVNFDFSESWIGDGDNIFTYGKYSDEIEHIGTAITRLDGTTVSGFGKIAQVEIVITDVVLGLVIDSTACLPFTLDFANVLGINEFEEDLLIEAEGDSLILKNESQLTSNNNLLGANSSFKIYPNPVENLLFVQPKNDRIESVTVYDLLGREVFQESFESYNLPQEEVMKFDLSNVYNGLYIINIKGQYSNFAQKILLK